MRISLNMMKLYVLIILTAASVVLGQTAAEYQGTVLSKSGDIVMIRLEGTPQLESCMSMSIHKFFAGAFLGVKTTGWLHAAEGKFMGLKDSVATVKVTSEKSRMTVNNKKVEHLAPGTKVKLVCK